MTTPSFPSLRGRVPSVATTAIVFTLAAGATAPRRAAGQTAVGRVLESGTRRQLRGVLVALVDSAGHTARQTTTDSAGVFYLDAPAPGRYALTFSWAGTTLTTAAHAFAAGEESQAEYVLGAVTPAAAPSSSSPPSAPSSTTPPPSADSGDARAYFEFMVAKPVTVRRGNPAPRYPEDARRHGITADVLAQFVVDTTGRAELATLRFLRSGGVDFDHAVREVLPAMRFDPARVTSGQKVRQIVQMPFEFSLEPALSPPCLPRAAAQHSTSPCPP